MGACVEVNTCTQAIRIFLRLAKISRVIHWQEYIMRGVEAEAEAGGGAGAEGGVRAERL